MGALHSVALCTLVALGCASTPFGQLDAEGATLEVENRTPEDLALSVRGRTEGIVRARARLRMHHLAAGPAHLVGRAVRGGAGAFSAETSVVLRVGEHELWSVLPDAAGGEALAEVPPLGALVVQNPSQKDITLLIGGTRMGRVFAGATRRFDDLASGPLVLSARPDDGSSPAEAEIVLPPGGEAHWRFEPAGAALRIENGTDEALELTIDGRPLGRLASGAIWEGHEAPGLRLLMARSEPSRRPYETVLVLTADARAVWKVAAGQSALVVENGTGEPLQVEVGGRDPVAVAPRGEARFLAMPAGPVEVKALGTTSRLAYAARLELMPAQTVTWVAGPVTGSVRVDNRTARVITVYTTLGGEERERGQVQPGAVALVRSLPRTVLGFSAIAHGTTRRQSTSIDLSAFPAATWVVTATTGAVHIRNDRDEPLDAFVDALRQGEVPAHGQRTFTGIEIGLRLVECIGRASGATHRERLTITEEGLAEVAVQDTAAFVDIQNSSGEAIEPRGALFEQAPDIPAGATVTMRVRAGKQRLIALGRDSGIIYGHELLAVAGQRAAWVVRAEPARVIVWNRLAETVAVTLDDRAQGTLAPDATLVLAETPPGRHRVQVVGLRTSAVHTEELRVASGTESKVTFTAVLGVLLVENRSQEKVEVRIDGALFGDALGGAIHAFGKVAPGPREVELYFRTSQRLQRVQVEVREGERARIVAEAPLGLLVVDNSSHQDVRVIIDGQAIAVVPADAGPMLVSAPSGGRHVQIERLEDRTQLGFHLQIRADSAIHVPVPPRVVRLVVLNRTAQPLTIFLGERRIAEVLAHASDMFEDVPDGEVRLVAKDAGGAVTHEELRRLYAGETATWVLDLP